MQLINSEISEKTCTRCNDDGFTPSKLLKYYAGVGSDQYTSTPVVRLVTNTGVRIEVDSSIVDIQYPPKYQWKFSTINLESNVGLVPGRANLGHSYEKAVVEEYQYYETPISLAAYNLIQKMVTEAEKLTGYGTTTTLPEWKTLSKDRYTNGHGGETFKRYNSYNGMLSKNGINTPRPHVTS